jgi:hypothetical protein
LYVIARQIAYTPSAAIHRLEASKIVNELADELRLATFVTQRTATLLEFVVADRDGDGTEERIRYEWSGTPGDPLLRSYNDGDSIEISESVQDFSLAFTSQDITTSIETTTDSAEVLLQSNTTLQSSNFRNIDNLSWAAQQIDPSTFTSAPPANALHWNATRVEFQASKSSPVSGTLFVQLCSTGSPVNGPTSHTLGQADIGESNLTTVADWNNAPFASQVRNLALHRKYAIVWSTASSSAVGKLRTDTNSASGVLESTDGGASWQYMSTKQLYYRLYGTYTTPGPTYDVTRSYLSNVAVRLQTSAQAHSRVDASISLTNLPELLSAYWRTDFDTDPTVSDVNGDGTADWQAAEAVGIVGAVPYDASSLSEGTWRVKGQLQTQPLNDFSKPTTVEVRLRDTSAGGSGAITWINADWGNGLAASLAIGVWQETAGTQSFWMGAQTSDVTWKVLLEQDTLTTEFVRCRLTFLPEHDLVNVEINGQDMGTFSYPTYAMSSNDRFLYVYGDTDTAEFDYVEVRVSETN